jgi:hypothetical protein
LDDALNEQVEVNLLWVIEVDVLVDVFDLLDHCVLLLFVTFQQQRACP